MKTLQLHNLLLVAVFSSALFTSCREDDREWFPVKGTGPVLVQERSVPAFTKLRSGVSANIIIAESSERTLKISVQENLVSLLETEVIDGTLFISFGKHAISTDSLIAITISQPAMSEITLAGNGTAVSALPVNAVNITGSASLKCFGQTNQVSVKLSGSGSVDLEEMEVKKADVKISGNGNVSLRVSDRLNVTIPGTGIVYYQGTPEIQKTITGVGQVISKN